MRLLLSLLAVSGLLASCGGGDDAPAMLLYGTAEGIVQRRIDTGETTLLIPLPAAQHGLRDPAVSPDGAQLVYVDAPPLRRVQGALDASADIWIANRDGTEPRILYERTALAEAASSPRWLDDGTILFIVRTSLDPADPASGADYRLVRMNVETGEVSRLVDDALYFDLSPDRTQIAYVKIESAAEQPLFIANADGTDEQRRLDAAGSPIEGFSAVAFARDGESVLLTAHGEVSAFVSATASGPGGGRLASLLHVAPLDLWRVPVAGGEPTLAAATQIDGGGLVEGEDGHVYVLSSKLLDVEIATGAMTTITEPTRQGGVFYEAP